MNPEREQLMREQVAELTRVGLSARQIAERLGCSKRTVTRWRRVLLIESGGVPGESVAAGVNDRLAEAARLIADGAPQREVARTLHIHHRTLRREFPGTAWDRSQIGEFARLSRKLQAIDPHNILRDAS